MQVGMDGQSIVEVNGNRISSCTIRRDHELRVPVYYRYARISSSSDTLTKRYPSRRRRRMMLGKACTVFCKLPPLPVAECIRMIDPGRTCDNTLVARAVLGMPDQSRLSTFHKMILYPSATATWITVSLKAPYGGRKKRGRTLPTRFISSLALRSSVRTCPADSRDILG